MSRAPRVLCFVEDPGAANCMLPLFPALAGAGWEVHGLAAGSAVAYAAEHAASLRAIESGSNAHRLIEGVQPALVMVGTSENTATMGLGLVAAARAAGVPTVGLLDSPANAAYRFRGTGSDPLGFAPDRLVVPDTLTASNFEALGYPSDRIHVCGHPYFDHIRSLAQTLHAQGRPAVRRRVMPAAPRGRPVVVFLAEVSDGLAPEQFRRSDGYTLHGTSGSSQRTHIVLEEVIHCVQRLSPRPYLVLRLHPKNDIAEFSAYAGAIDLASAGGMALELVYAADLVVGMSTSLLAEASLMGCRTLSVVPRERERSWLTTVALGVTPCVFDRPRLHRALPEILRAPPPAATEVDALIPPGAVASILGLVTRLHRPDPVRA